MRLSYLILNFPLIVFIYSCASQMPPTGGPKDEDPPVLEYSIPPNFALNFNESTIELVFDELVIVFNLKNELIITPTFSGKYSSKIRKNSVILTFEEPFPDSTTFTLNFREGIKDITEGNAAENLRLAFSTWGFIDSLSIEGTITDLFKVKPVDNYTVGIFDVTDTITPLNGLPLYFTRTNKSGQYIIENIKQGKYRIYAFNDKNNNLLIESRSEEYGFIPQILTLDSSLTAVNIRTQHIDFNDLEIIAARQNGHYYEIKTSKYVIDHSLGLLDISDTLIYILTENNRTFKIFNTFHIADSVALLLEITDSLLTTVSDTVYMHFEETSRSKDDFNVNFSEYPNIKKETNIFRTRISFTKPGRIINPDSIKIVWDSLHTTTFPVEYFIFNKYKTEVTIEKDLTDDPNYIPDSITSPPRFMLDTAAIISIEEDSNKHIKSEIRFLEVKDFGIIKGEIDVPYMHFIIQLIDEKHKVIRSFRDVNEYYFDYLSPGKYKLRLLAVQDNDGYWFPGNLTDNIEHEPVLYYISESGDAELTIRANWELVDISIKTDTLNVN